MAFARLAIIGGSGLGAALGRLMTGTPTEVKTPFGDPSGPIVMGELDGVPVALLARHGPGHRHNPSRVPYRANIHALKQLGVTHVLASAAAGSLQEDIHPRELVICDQLIDRTYKREGTFFDELAVHTELGAPFCPTVRQVLLTSGQGLGIKVHPKGTLVVMEGPAFSTRAECDLHRSWGAHLIGMTACPEAKLAREAQLCYGLVGLPTDYDCWKPHPDNVSEQELGALILGNLHAATESALALAKVAVRKIAEAGAAPCHCQTTLKNAVWTDRAMLSAATKEKLKVLLPDL
jgi:5'-methylthioadenosine phosphorylase